MTAPARYRKKPVVIEAMHLDRDASTEDLFAVYMWVESHIGSVPPPIDNPVPDQGVTIDPEDGAFVIRTLEGDMKADLGDYVIKGVQGEFYPCKPDIFDATYEPAEDAS